MKTRTQRIGKVRGGDYRIGAVVAAIREHCPPGPEIRISPDPEDQNAATLYALGGRVIDRAAIVWFFDGYAAAKMEG